MARKVDENSLKSLCAKYKKAHECDNDTVIKYYMDKKNGISLPKLCRLNNLDYSTVRVYKITRGIEGNEEAVASFKQYIGDSFNKICKREGVAYSSFMNSMSKIFPEVRELWEKAMTDRENYIEKRALASKGKSDAVGEFCKLLIQNYLVPSRDTIVKFYVDRSDSGPALRELCDTAKIDYRSTLYYKKKFNISDEAVVKFMSDKTFNTALQEKCNSLGLDYDSVVNYKFENNCTEEESIEYHVIIEREKNRLKELCAENELNYSSVYNYKCRKKCTNDEAIYHFTHKEEEREAKAKEFFSKPFSNF